MKKFVWLTLAVIVFLNIEVVEAGKVHLDGTNYKTNEVQVINDRLDSLNTLYGTNLDILLLGQDNKNCYKQNNYIQCAIDNLNVTGSYIWTINIGIKETTGKGDVNSWMSSNVNNTRNIISEVNMKTFQEQSLSYLKKEDVLGAADSFVKLFETHLVGKCNNLKSRGSQQSIEINNCKLTEFSEKLPLIEQKEKIIRDKQNAVTIARIAKEKEEERIILEKERIILEKERKILFEKTITVLKYGLGWMVIIFIAVILGRETSKYVHKRGLYKKASQLASDLRDYKIFIEKEDLLLEADKGGLLNQIITLEANVEIMIGNKFVDEKNLLEFLSDKGDIEREASEKMISQKDLDSVNKDLDKAKDINL